MQLIIKLFLNLVILGGLGGLYWLGHQLFIEHVTRALAGSVLFIIGIVAWVVLIILSRKWRGPSLKLTTFLTLIILGIFAFAGVQPFASYREVISNRVTSWMPKMENSLNATQSEDPLNTIHKRTFLDLTGSYTSDSIPRTTPAFKDKVEVTSDTMTFTDSWGRRRTLNYQTTSEGHRITFTKPHDLGKVGYLSFKWNKEAGYFTISYPGPCDARSGWYPRCGPLTYWKR